jgi:GLPGLI family protein
MRFYIFITSILLFSYKLPSQNGLKINYKYGVYGFDENKDIPETIKKSHNYSKSFLYELVCNNQTSLFKMIDEVHESNDLAYKTAKIGANAFSWYFSNIKTSEKIKQTFYEGEEIVNIISSPNKFNWTITKESKMILNYKCFKATCHIEYYSKLRNKLMSFDPIVWFTPDIPFPFGPIGLDGLPGLVLEATFNGKRYYYATKIQTNIKINPKELQLKKADKTYTEEEYENIVAAKSNIPRN